MLIHSVTHPLLLTEYGLPAQSARAFPGGVIEGVDTPEGFVVSRLCSTDLSLYLKDEYAPGNIYRF